MKDSRKTEADESPMAAKIVQIDEGQIRSHVDQVVRGGRSSRRSMRCWRPKPTPLCGAGRYERSPERADTRAGHYRRKLHTKAGQVDR
jgi:hypothetical protein